MDIHIHFGPLEWIYAARKILPWMVGVAAIMTMCSLLMGVHLKILCLESVLWGILVALYIAMDKVFRMNFVQIKDKDGNLRTITINDVKSSAALAEWLINQKPKTAEKTITELLHGEWRFGWKIFEKAIKLPPSSQFAVTYLEIYHYDTAFLDAMKYNHAGALRRLLSLNSIMFEKLFSHHMVDAECALLLLNKIADGLTGVDREAIEKLAQDYLKNKVGVYQWEKNTEYFNDLAKQYPKFRACIEKIALEKYKVAMSLSNHPVPDSTPITLLPKTQPKKG